VLSVASSRLDVPGTLHLVMIRGINKRKIVNNIADRKNFVKRMGELAAGTKTGVYAWALMTNHAHILLRSAEIGISGFKRRLLTGNAISYTSKRASVKGVGRSLSVVG
jgi:putative transposase